MTALPRGRTMTRADLEALPDDGWRHELVDPGSTEHEPSITAWQLEGDVYGEAVTARGRGRLAVSQPYAVAI